MRSAGDRLCGGSSSAERPHHRRSLIGATQWVVLPVDALTLFGLFAVAAMLVFYAFEDRSAWFVLAFAAACAMGSVYGFLQGAWPFGLVEAVWTLIALKRWRDRTTGGTT
jgi:hypothetical protein